MKIILGPPGTGKTTTLLNVLDDELKSVNPDQVAFVSFTRKGAYEARDRAIEKFRFNKSDLPYFRTLHSLGYSLNRGPSILEHSHYKEIGEHLGLEFSRYTTNEDIPGGVNDGDRMLFLIEYARNTRQELKTVWNDHSSDTNWYQVLQLKETLEKYKRTRTIKDFTDLIENSIGKTVPIKVAIIDEAQDLSTLQWKMVESVFRNAERTYVGGDDDQAIYKWSGADVNYFLNLDGDVKTLKKSYRLSKDILELSEGITGKINNRYDKKFQPKDDIGRVSYHNYIETIPIDRESTWLLLARNRYLLKQFEKHLRYNGYLYSKHGIRSVNEEHCNAIYAWEAFRLGKHINEEERRLVSKLLGKNIDKMQKKPWFEAFQFIPFNIREYYRDIMRHGHHLTEQPKISINTIHSVKGGEADNVAILTDMAAKTYNSYLRNGDDEHRVFYVGMTRTKKDLHIVYPQSERGYYI